MIRTRVRVVKDEPSQRIIELPDSARISDRAKISFGTGETHGARVLKKYLLYYSLFIMSVFT